MMGDVLKSLRSDLEALCDEGLVSKVTLREFDKRHMSRLKPMTAEQIKISQIRSKT